MNQNDLTRREYRMSSLNCWKGRCLFYRMQYKIFLFSSNQGYQRINRRIT